MIVVIARLRIAPGAAPAMLEELNAFASYSRTEHGCLEYTPLRSPEHDDLIVIVERWEDRASLDVHLTSAEMASYRRATAHLVVERTRTVLEANEIAP